MRMVVSMLMLALMATSAGSARADVTFTFQENGTGDLGTSGPLGKGTFTVDGLTITTTAYTGIKVAHQSGRFQYSSLANGGYGTAAGAPDLYAKFTSGNASETGLGLANDPQHEVKYGYGILIDFSQVKGYQPFQVSFGSVQSASNDVAAVYDYSTGNLVSTFDTNGNATITIGGNPATTDYQYLFTEANNQGHNVLLTSVSLHAMSIASVPEPSSMLIVAVGGIGFLGYGLRRRAWVA